MSTSITSDSFEGPGSWVVTAFGGPSVLEWRQWTSLPKPQPQTARVRILICGVSGADNIMRTGGYTRFPQTSQPGFTPGYEITGVIEEIAEGTDKQGFEVGDIVASIVVVGGYGTHLVVPMDDMLKLRQEDEILKVSALPVNYMTGYGMMKLSAFPLGESTSSVLIGSVAGGVGTALAQLVHLYYPKVKIFGSALPSKFEFVRSLGVIPVDRYTPPERLPDLIRSLNGGEGVDIAYDATGSPIVMESFLAATKDGTGKLVAIGFIANVKTDGSGVEEHISDPIEWCTQRSQRASFFSVTNHFWRGNRELFKHVFEHELLSAVRSGKLEPKVTKVWRIDQARELHQGLATGNGITGKHEIVIDQAIWKQVKGL